jgi:hypothetical protein
VGWARFAPQSDKATALVVSKIVELSKAGRKGDDLIEQTLLAFKSNEAEGHRGTAVPSSAFKPLA